MRTTASRAALLLCMAIAGCAAPGKQGVHAERQALRCDEERADFAQHFHGVRGTFVLHDMQTGRTLCHNPQRAAERFLPASTFKIPNTLIALESGVASGPDFFLPWDRAAVPPQAWWPAAWSQDQTLRSALKNSVVWYYKELARRTGRERMQSYVDRFDYGNRDISGGIDQFWLSGGLRISAEEQVDFLQRFYSGKLGISERSTRLAKDMLVLEETPEYRLSGKTGWAGLGEPGTQTGWLVGYLERDGQAYPFALNIHIEKNEDAAARMATTKSVLRQVGLLPRQD
ncbi:MAG: penicillin-binding transpeptidase domain-containing protein [Burkholderiaceae bacterium]